MSRMLPALLACAALGLIATVWALEQAPLSGRASPSSPCEPLRDDTERANSRRVRGDDAAVTLRLLKCDGTVGG